MDVILLERVQKLGTTGEVVRVKDGYARNYLLPKGKALRATEANKARFEKERAIIEKRNQEQRGVAVNVAEKLDGKTFILIRQAGESGQLYGSVSTRDIAECVASEGTRIHRTQVVLNTPIKTLGLHKLPVQLYGDVMINITINIARSNEEAERQARGEQTNLRERMEVDFTPGNFSEDSAA